jgi:glycosidase
MMFRMNTASLRCSTLTAFTLALALAVCHGQTAKPVITRIDPPNWFTSLPDSLLLVHGEHLENTTFAVAHTRASLSLESISPNGHWAFLNFKTASAEPGTLEITATNRFGSTSATYTLTARRPLSEQPRGFSSADVMYLIMPDRFADGDLANDHVAGFKEPDDRSLGRAYHGGDLKGIEDHLDYLQQLGVTTLWTTPLYDNSGNQSRETYHGYSATNLYAVDPHLGTMASYQALVRAAHRRGMKIVLDTVPNHVGPGIDWVNDQPTVAWLHGTLADHVATKGNFTAVTDPNASPEERHLLLDGWFANFLPDLNQDNPLVAQYLVQNAIWWIEMAGLDGLRIDTFPYVPRSFWHTYHEQLHTLYPKLTDVGEIFDPNPKTTSFFAGGRAHTGSDGTVDTGLNTPFDFPMYFALRKTITHQEPMTAIADVLAQDALYPQPERLVTFLANHDVKRFLNEPGADAAGLRLGFGLLATLRGMPELYYGDEIDMTGGDDPDNRRDFPGGFPGDKADAFTAAGRTPQQQAMHDWVAELFHLRARTPALLTGAQRQVLVDKDTLAFVRGANLTQPCGSSNDGRVLVVANNAVEARDIALDASTAALNGCNHYKSLLPEEPSFDAAREGLRVHLAGQQIGIFLAQP